MTTPTQAYDLARAKVMRAHFYKIDNESITASCSCGVKAPAHDINVHIEKEAQQAGLSAKESAEAAQ